MKTKYKHIVAWERFMGGLSYYLEAQLQAAEKENAPIDAIYKREEGWQRFSDVTNPETRAKIESILAGLE